MDEIIHLGDFWNEDGLRANRESIMSSNREVGRLFARAYKYIKAAASVYEDTAVINGWAMDSGKANAVAAGIVKELLGDQGIAVKEGKERRLFASAITPDGLKNYLPTVLTCQKVYNIKGAQGTGTEKLLEKVRAAVVERGYDVECYYCPLFPEKLEHLVIPGLDAAFTTVNAYHDAGVQAYMEVDFNEYLDSKVLEAYSGFIEDNRRVFDELLNNAIGTIKKAKAVHDLMETYYVPNMDFEAIDRCREATLARVLKYAEEFN